MVFKIGQLITANQDIELERAISGEKVIVKKGSKAIVGADNLVHHLDYDMMIQPISKSVKIEGYDAEGLTAYLFRYLKYQFPIEQFCNDYDVSERSFCDEITDALREIGF